MAAPPSRYVTFVLLFPFSTPLLVTSLDQFNDRHNDRATPKRLKPWRSSKVTSGSFPVFPLSPFSLPLSLSPFHLSASFSVPSTRTPLSLALLSAHLLTILESMLVQSRDNIMACFSSCLLLLTSTRPLLVHSGSPRFSQPAATHQQH